VLRCCASSRQVYLEALSELQDRLPSFPNEIAWAVIEEELGVPVAEFYEQLSEQPVAAASLGQVSTRMQDAQAAQGSSSSGSSINSGVQDNCITAAAPAAAACCVEQN
jgi:hypothetical protein